MAFFPSEVTKSVSKGLSVIVCKDKVSKKKCEAWRRRGDCGSNPGWMSVHCGKTCNFCGPNKEGKT